MTRPANSHDYDVVVIGSGFGGSVSALRLTEKGYSVGVVEAGQRFDEHNTPKNSWDIRNFVWAPALGCTGMQRIHLLKNVVILAGAGVGGGSLNYANTLYEPPAAFYADPQWAHITDWADELAPYYRQAKKMLGVTVNPTMTQSDREMLRLAEQFDRADTFRMTPVGVFFGREGRKEPGQRVADPFFGGAGPERTGCIECGECMTGCRHGAKNTLTTNYLGLAERAGAVVHPLTTVTGVRPLRAGGYAVDTVRTGGPLARRHRRTFTAEQVVFSAGTYNTQKLLHTLRETSLPDISPRLGHLTRTNSEALLGALTKNRRADYTHGVAITSSWHPDPDTHIEPVRYGKGSNAMGLLTTALTEGGTPARRWREWLSVARSNPSLIFTTAIPRHWSERIIILLVMQSLNNSITVRLRKSRRGKAKLTSTQGAGEPNPTWIPVANQAARQLADNIGGVPGGTYGDLFNIPMTAHFIGGCAIGDSAETGVIDPYHRLYGYAGLHVVDGSTLSANLGVNPSLSITAQAERAMALWPNAGEQDTRPALGQPYRRLDPVAPKNPAVPAHAPAALQFAPLQLGPTRLA
ncbi:GMC family oxidoreductase [Jatrophihabitans telluris]|uniref:Cholesterol oxidase n=1 Tax=Jatrophihabitans telluris TaxID=2038343 RepID=A0ABY4QZ54_9ACTN|nr:GMC family oxidoreductase [Jatrophihabitans telluris]UQX88850.1 GMC family oxidoreductase [Jatrophihabitans telluris]